tara:strand:+ start:177 stop:611 length:435 start_codon:yes stop_codon:yes gene_type:complete
MPYSKKYKKRKIHTRKKKAGVRGDFGPDNDIAEKYAKEAAKAKDTAIIEKAIATMAIDYSKLADKIAKHIVKNYGNEMETVANKIKKIYADKADAQIEKSNKAELKAKRIAKEADIAHKKANVFFIDPRKVSTNTQRSSAKHSS